jgi:hypothetical protein
MMNNKVIAICMALMSSSSMLMINSMPAQQQPDQLTMRPSNLRLLATSETDVKWADPEELMQKDVKFVDITDHTDLEVRAPETMARLAKFRMF